jgi:hypothetical protein
LFFVVHAQAFSINLKYRQACCGRAKGIFSQIHYMLQNNIGILLSIHKPFLVEIELRVVNKNKHTKKQVWGTT